jgi:hypothetical protein
MQKVNFKLFSILALLLFTTQFLSAQNEYPKGYFRSPLDIPLLLSGNFAEMRSTHFHTGLDFKTQGEEGFNIYSIADGYVSRIKVQAGGYGNAIYITHPNGYVSVYGHLQKYSDAISEYVQSEQYRRKSFELNLFPPADKFLLKRGDVIGLSGNTGRSGGPHLHFEIRDARTEHPLNPLHFGFDVTDNIAPKAYSIAVYPLSNYSFVEGESTVFISTIQNGKPVHNPIEAYGELGFGIRANDFLNGSNNKCGLYSLELFVDSTLVFSYIMDELDFGEVRYILSHYDYQYKKEKRRYIQKSFVAANNKLSNYRNVKDQGIVEIYDDSIHQIEYVLTDAYKNTTKIAFQIQGKKPDNIDSLVAKNEYTQAMPCKIENTFENEELQLIIPKNALYDDLFFDYSKEDSVPGIFSSLHHVHSDIVPLHRHVQLKIKAKNLPDSLQSKALIVSVNGENGSSKMYGASGEYNLGWVSTKVRAFGDYAVGVDTISPSIIPINIQDSAMMDQAESIRFKIIDDLAGITKYEGFIDGEWVLFRHDAKSNLIWYEFADNKISRGSYHNLLLNVIDDKNNEAKYEAMFYW